jgi:hypothetical protein
LAAFFAGADFGAPDSAAGTPDEKTIKQATTANDNLLGESMRKALPDPAANRKPDVVRKTRWFRNAVPAGAGLHDSATFFREPVATKV